MINRSLFEALDKFHTDVHKNSMNFFAPFQQFFLHLMRTLFNLCFAFFRFCYEKPNKKCPSVQDFHGAAAAGDT